MVVEEKKRVEILMKRARGYPLTLFVFTSSYWTSLSTALEELLQFYSNVFIQVSILIDKVKIAARYEGDIY